jgi:hypothetical protein
MKAAGEEKLVNATNAFLVGAADRLVYGSSDSQLRFIQNRMGKAPVPSLIERMRELQRTRYDDLLKTLREMPIPARR